MKKFIALASLILIVLSSQAQVKEVSSNREEFISDLSNHMTYHKKKEGKKFIEDEFTPAYTAERFDASLHAKIVSTTNMLLKSKIKAKPDFENWLKAIIAYAESTNDVAYANQWLEFITELQRTKKSKKFTGEFLRQSVELIKNNTFYNTPSIAWKTTSNNYKLEFDSIPSLVLESGALVCYSRKDSSVITGTSGVYDFMKERFYGDKGKVTWQRAGLDPEKTYCEFNEFQIRIKGASYSVEDVTFYNEYFNTPLEGVLKEKVLANKNAETANFPRFESYNQFLEIKNIFEKVDYSGGFTMAGSKLAGTGSEETPAQLTFFKDGKPFLKARSLEYTIRPNRINSLKSSMTLFLEEDSIYHPDLNLKFENESRVLALIKSEEGVSKAPFNNTYHGVDIFVDAMYWNVDDPLLTMGAIKGSSNQVAVLESFDFFKKERYKAMMGFQNTHPLVQISDFSKAYGVEKFHVSELAQYMRMGSDQVDQMLIDLNNKGFVQYDLDTKVGVIRQKLRDYVTASGGNRDYDVLQFASDTRGQNDNAQLNLVNYDLLVRGVGRINLSDSQEVVILPSKEEVILKKGRDFKCGGRVFAGNFEFIGKDYDFKYDSFTLGLNQVDSTRIYVDDSESTTDLYGNKKQKRIKNVVEGIKGTLKIDAPNNKSGILSEEYPEYPILTSENDAYVYYDNSNIQNGVYKKDEFYYQIEPFVIDSLDNFETTNMKFDGTLVSNIFPDIKEPLVIMDDYSLGFDKSTGGSGLPVYEGKGDFTKDIKLSYDGLQGSGELEFLTSLSSSNQFTFFPDSTKGVTSSFINKESLSGVEVPKAQAFEVDLAYFPTEQRLSATVREEPIIFFENEANLVEGSLVLEPTGMKGNGQMDFAGAELYSEEFNYESRKILADSSAFRLQAQETENLAFKTDNVKAEIDFDKRVGEFNSNGDETKVELPANQYFCFMDKFKWFMDEDKMELSSSRTTASDFVIDTDETKSSSNFFSVNQYQDSLNFLAPKATYDIKNNIIDANGIEFIAVADAKISPDSGHVKIYKRAKMETLKNSTIIANYVTQHHTMFNADIDIRGRLDYEGEADYTYIDKTGLEQIIHLDKIKVDTTDQTIAYGKIMEEDAFALSPNFEFQGDFNLVSSIKNLNFKGGARIAHDCEFLEKNWLKFESAIDPTEIYIPIDTAMKSITARKLTAGAVITSESPFKTYGTFLGTTEDKDDMPLISSTGFVYYDEAKKSYLIGSKEKIKQPKLAGNLVELSTESCGLAGDGKINFDANLGLLEIDQIGGLTYNTITNETNIDGVCAVDYFFDEGLTKLISEKIQKSQDLAILDITKTKYEKGIIELLPQAQADKLISELNIQGQIKKIPEELRSLFYFADAKWTWDDDEESFHTVGKLGLASMGKKDVFKYVKGKIEIQKKRSFDVFNMYLEIDPSTWYFFECKNGIMSIITSDKEFTTALAEVKDDKRRTKGEGGLKFSYMMVASKKKRNDFIDRFDDLD